MSPHKLLNHAPLTAFALILAASTAVAQVDPFHGGRAFMTGEDLQMLNEKADKLLDKGKVGSVASWKNEKSGNFGTMEVELVFAGNGIPCRRIDHVIKFKDEADPRIFRLTYCRVGDEWKISE